MSSLSIAVVAAAAVFVSSALNDQTAQYKPREKSDAQMHMTYAQSFRGYAEWMFNMRKDPVTNALNYPAMITASTEVQEMMKNPGFHSAMVGLNWQEKGPDNVGGRTRALLIDRNNPNKIFAGGVAGGLWISANGGANWAPYNDQLENLTVSSLTQASNGDIYFGTGEGLYYFLGTNAGGFIGGGVWKSTDGGATFTRLTSTIPSASNSATVAWVAVNDMGASPTNPNRIYACTNQGLKISDDGGVTWVSGITSPVNQNCTDISVASDGSVAVGYNEKVYISPNGDAGTYVLEHGTNSIDLPNVSLLRCDVAFAPSDPNYIYAVLIKTDNYLHSVWVSKDKGSNWYKIGNGGSINYFNPFGTGQGYYDCMIGVLPTNKNKIILGGVTLWSYVETQTNPAPAGQWTQVDSQYESPFNPFYVHSDKHAIKFIPNTNTCYIGCDGGIFRSTDGGTTFQPMNRGYNVTQFTSVAFSKTGNEYMGGTQDNGTQYVDHTGNSWLASQHVAGGDGAYTDISIINPDAQFAGSYYGAHFRSPNNGGSYSDYYNVRINNLTNMGNPGFANFVTPFRLYENLQDVNSIDSVTFTNDSLSYVLGSADGISAQLIGTLPKPQTSASLQPGSVIFKAGNQTITDNGSGGLIGSINISGVNTIDYNTGAFNLTFNSVPSINTVLSSEYNVVYTSGDVLQLGSNNGNFPFTYTLTSNLNPGQSVTVQDRITARMAVGFSGSVWMTKSPLDFSVDPDWIKIAGGNARTMQGGVLSPAFGGEVQTMEWSRDGNHLFVGTSGGHVYRISNLNLVVDSINGDVDSANGANTNAIVRTTRLGQFGGSVITSIAVDPNNADNIVVTTGNYGSTNHVYMCDSAVSSIISTGNNNTSKFKIKQGNLPSMPVYGSIIDMVDGGIVVIGTEYGVYTTDDITATTPVWTEQNTGMAHVPTLMVRQQQHRNWVVSNPGQLWIATHGRGIFSSDDLMIPLGNNNPAPFGDGNTAFQSSIKIFPNPMSTEGSVSFFMPSNGLASIEIYNINGKLVKKIDLGKLTVGSYTRTIEVDDLAKGTYFVNVIAAGQKAAGKFVKMN